MCTIGTEQGLLGRVLLSEHFRRTMQLEASTPQAAWNRLTGSEEGTSCLGTDRWTSLTHPRWSQQDTTALLRSQNGEGDAPEMGMQMKQSTSISPKSTARPARRLNPRNITWVPTAKPLCMSCYVANGSLMVLENQKFGPQAGIAQSTYLDPHVLQGWAPLKCCYHPANLFRVWAARPQLNTLSGRNAALPDVRQSLSTDTQLCLQSHMGEKMLQFLILAINTGQQI